MLIPTNILTQCRRSQWSVVRAWNSLVFGPHRAGLVRATGCTFSRKALAAETGEWGASGRASATWSLLAKVRQ